MRIKNLFLASMMIVSPYVLPYPGLMPGNKLYRVKQVLDKIVQVWSFGSFSRHKYELNMADKKIIEAKVLFEYQQYPLAIKALEDSNAHFQQAGKFLEQAKKENKNIVQKEKIYKSAAKEHEEILKSLGNFLPEKFIWQLEKKQAIELNLKSSLEEAIKIREI